MVLYNMQQIHQLRKGGSTGTSIIYVHFII